MHAKAIEAQRPAVPWWVIWGGLLALNVACHVNFLFLQPHAEIGDYAANALQIRNAKFFQELYGNYSRWGFHHPGPAFFYVYAAGEWIFADLLKLVRSPFSAHILAGMILQTGFFTWTLCIIRKQIAKPLLVPLLLLGGAIHFGLVNYYFQDSIFGSIWPPFILLFPFLCFVVACASLAAGESRDLVAATVAGSFLVHGHVAQPLFVVPCFMLALSAFLWRAWREEGSLGNSLRRHRRWFLVSLAILALAVTPLILDLSHGERSNLRAIFQHFTSHSSDHKSLGASLVYLASFFFYLQGPETFSEKFDSATWSLFQQRWHFAAGWSLVFLLLVLLAWPLIRRNRFARWLGYYFVIAIILTVGWGILQNGPMYNFNSFFNFGLLFISVALLAAVLSTRIPFPKGRVLEISATALAIVFFIPMARAWRLSSDFTTLSYPSTGTELEVAARADSRRTKYLIFPHGNWPNAIGVALALERAGFNYAVSPQWGFMFGQEHTQSLEAAVLSNDVAIWTFAPRLPALTGFTDRQGQFVATARSEIDPQGGAIDLTGANPNWAQYCLAGCQLSENGQPPDVGALEFQPMAAQTDVEIAIRPASPQPSVAPDATLAVSFESLELARIQPAMRDEIRARIPRDLWNQERPAHLLFRTSQPSTAGAISSWIERIEFRPAPE